VTQTHLYLTQRGEDRTIAGLRFLLVLTGEAAEGWTACSRHCLTVGYCSGYLKGALRDRSLTAKGSFQTPNSDLGETKVTQGNPCDSGIFGFSQLVESTGGDVSCACSTGNGPSAERLPCFYVADRALEESLHYFLTNGCRIS